MKTISLLSRQKVMVKMHDAESPENFKFLLEIIQTPIFVMNGLWSRTSDYSN